jgi:hypothetical protein
MKKTRYFKLKGFEEPFLIPGGTLLGYMFPFEPKKGFYLEPKMVFLCGQPKNPFGTVFSESIQNWLRYNVTTTENRC